MSINLYYGEETYLLETAVKKLKKEFGETKQGINYIELDEENFINNLMPEIQTPSFGYPKKMIIAKNTGLFKKETKKKVTGLKELRDTLEKYLKENIEIINETLELIFIEDSVEKLNITKTVEALGGTIKNFEQEKPMQIQKRLEAICKAYKVTPEAGTLNYLIENSGTSLQELINEIRKQIEYAGEGGTITKKSIDDLAIKTLDSNIFNLTDNLGRKDIAKALQNLEELLYQKEPIQKILITLYNHFKKLYIIKLSEKYKKDPSEALNLKPNQTFLITKYKTQSRAFGEIDLRNILNELITLDTNYKLGKIDINIGLEAILCRYCS